MKHLYCIHGKPTIEVGFLPRKFDIICRRDLASHQPCRAFGVAVYRHLLHYEPFAYVVYLGWRDPKIYTLTADESLGSGRYMR